VKTGGKPSFSETPMNFSGLRGSISLKIFATKPRLNFNGLHGFVSQKIALFIITAVRTSNSSPYIARIDAILD
jgi:hypothetical protein